ncbi:MAG: cell wall hydrolase [Alphaproteobacteria bacterium]|nr:cell wall hydrolase [Alphaproteobacteria bacterium]
MIHFLKPLTRGKHMSISARDEDAEIYQKLSEDILARTLWGEARGEPQAGIEAVASVILNRVRIAQAKGGYWWGTDIISVCQKPYQFSCWNKSDPSYSKLIAVTERNKHFVQCVMIARRALAEQIRDITGGATHYHADYVSPYWITGQTPTLRVGRHIFYKLIEG